MKTGKIILTLLLLTAVGGALFLVRQNQDTRRGAAVAGASMSIVPSAKQVKKPGEELKYNVNFVLDNTNARVEAAQVKLCYTNHIEFKSVVGTKTSGFDAEPIAVVTREADGTNKVCTTVAFGSNGVTSDQINKLKSAGSIFEMTFTAKTKTGVQPITIDTAGGATVLGAYNPASADKTITVNNVAGGQYEITDTTCRSLWRINEKLNACEEFSSCDNQIMPVSQSFETKEECEAALKGDAPILNYKVSYKGVLPNDHKCMVNWPMQVIVLSRGTTKVYNNVVPSEVIDEQKKVVLKGSVVLTGFNYTDQVAAFFKGPKHLQMKYAVQNQNKNYEKAGGELVLTKSAGTSTWYDFTNHPMLPGDVVGMLSSADSGVSPPDGEINILDFSYVKGFVSKLETVSPGQDLRSDLNGNCQANSNDLYLLSASLAEKQGQLY